MRTVDLLLRTLCLRDGPDAAELRKAWSDVDAQGLASLVQFEGAELLLHRRLSDLHALDDAKPEFRAWLTRAGRNTVAWNMMVDAQMDEVARIFSDLRVPWVLLKGAVWRLTRAAYPYADARVVGDIDVLVRDEDTSLVWNRLRALGFTKAKGAHVNHFHLPQVSDGRIAIEVHRSVSRCYSPAESWKRMYSSSCLVERNELRFMVPSTTEMFWHSIVHAQNHGSDGFRVRFFQDAAVAMARAADIDWEEIARRLRSETWHDVVTRRWLRAALDLAGRHACDTLGPLPPFDLADLLNWRLSVFRTTRRDTRFARILVDQGTRVAVGLPRKPSLSHGAPLRNLRRRAAAATARCCYSGWRALQRTGAPLAMRRRRPTERAA